MARATPPYTSFNGGEVSPELEGRIDIEKYHASCYRLQNMIPMIQGPARRRSGSRFVKEVKDSTHPPQLSKFIFNVTQSLALEWGDQYLRFYTDHGALLEATKNVTGATQANPCVITCTSHGYSNGDEVFLSGLGGMTQLNNRYFKVAGVTTNTFQLHDYAGNNINSTAYAAYTSGGTVGRVYTVTSPYVYADLFDSNGLFTLRFAQIADVIYVTNTLSTYPVYKLSRLGNANWTLAPVVFSSGPFKPLNNLNTPLLLASGQTGAVTVNAYISAQVASTGSDGGGQFITLLQPLAAVPPNGTTIGDLTGNQNVTPTTTIAVGSTTSKLYVASNVLFNQGDLALISVGPTTPVFQSGHVGALLYLGTHDFHGIKPWQTGKSYSVGDLTTNNGVTYRCFDGGTSGTTPPSQLFGDAYDGPGKGAAGWTYQDPGYGWGTITAISGGGNTASVTVGDPTAIDPPVQYPIGVTGLTDWLNNSTGGIFPTPLWAIGAWNSVDGYPTHVYFFSNRLIFARNQSIWMSVSEDFENFAAETAGGVVTADMGISITAPVQDFITWLQQATSTAALAVGTSGGELVAGQITTSEPLGPANVQIPPQGTRGSRAIPALRVANGVIFVQTSGRKIRKFIYEFYTNSWQSSDLSVYARELPAPGILAMDYQQEPDSVIWMVREDGVLLGLTYDPPEVEDGQDVIGWHRHLLGPSLAGAASVTAIASIPAPDGTRDELWMLVERTINGRTVTYVEYLEKAFDTGDAQSSACFMDASAQYSGSPATTIFPLNHLEGETVRVLADGAAHPDCTVTNGQITLDAAHSVVQVGLATEYDLVTLRIEAGSQLGTAQSKLKRITRLNGIRLLNSLGGFYGQYQGDIPFADKISGPATLDEIKYRDTNDVMDSPPSLFTGDKVNLSNPSDWERNGRIEITSNDQFPMTVVALFPEMSTSE